ncbi:MAG TPA: DUF3465 domain-containing protein [Pyrinomonadaceae bacterium]
MTLKRNQEASLPIKRIYITSIILFALIWTAFGCAVQSLEHKDGTASDDTEIGRAFKTRTSNVQVEGEGIVTRILADDLDGSRHQRFIVRLTSGQTVLIAHNIDLAPRIATLAEGDSIGFYGEYVWNAQGGKVHWTHHDPGGKHVAGWLKHKGQTYQ